MSATEQALTPELIGQWLFQAMSGWRVQQLSLHDRQGESLWLSGGSLGPDDHADVQDAVSAFSLERENTHLLRRRDQRRVLYLAARSPLGECCGVAYAVLEGAALEQLDVIPPAIAAVLRRFSMLLAPPVTRSLSEVTARHRIAALPRPHGDAPMQARRYKQLRSGGSTRRFEICCTPVDIDDDARTLNQVAAWLQGREVRADGQNEQFFMPISAPAVMSKDFAAQLTTAMEKYTLDPEVLGLYLPPAAWRDRTERTRPLIELCNELGLAIALSDYWVGSNALELLRCKSVRLLKLDPQHLGAAMNQRFDRAMLASITQAARVLGLHCVARGPVTSSAAKWMASANIDYVDRFSAAEASGSTMSAELVQLPQSAAR